MKFNENQVQWHLDSRTQFIPQNRSITKSNYTINNNANVIIYLLYLAYYMYSAVPKNALCSTM